MVRPCVELVQVAVREIDPDHCRSLADAYELGFDVLVVTTGADFAADALPGYVAAADSFFDLDGAAGLWKTIQRFPGGRLVVAVASLPYKWPAAPYATALLLRSALRRRRVRSRTGIDAERREPISQAGAREPFNLLTTVPPRRAPAAVPASPLANPAGWVSVDKRTLRTEFENLYALGDVSAVTPANGKTLPKAEVLAHSQAPELARSLAAEIGGGRPARFNGVGRCWLDLGGGKAAFASGVSYAEPDPVVRLRHAGWFCHLRKILFQRSWMGDGLGRASARLGSARGSSALGQATSI